MSCASCSPATGIALNPHVPQPVDNMKPSTLVLPRIGEKSGLTSQMPAHERKMRSFDKNGNMVVAFAEQACR